MSEKEQKCIQHLEKGIQHKRNGDYKEAISEYELAYELDPFNTNVYKNMAKVLTPIGYHDYAFKNLLTYSHLLIKKSAINMDAYDFSIGFYEWSGQVNNDSKIREKLPIVAVSQDFNLAKIVADINLTLNAGVCYLYRNRDIVNYHQIPASYLNNYAKTLLGSQPDGPSIFDSEFANMTRAIGLSYLLRNLLTDPNLSETDITQVYFSDNYKIDNF